VRIAPAEDLVSGAGRAICVDGVTLALRVVRKPVKNVNARLVGGELRVSAPPQVPAAELDAIVERLARRLLRRVRAAEINRDGAALELARRVAASFDPPPTVADVRFATTQTARWGSYSTRTGIVRLHAALREMPEWVLAAVLAHELAHAVHPDHSPAFWRLLRGVCPDTDRADAFLAGVSWAARRWRDLPPVERSLLGGCPRR
jgi:predicted metal-dependent hydrolase